MTLVLRQDESLEKSTKIDTVYGKSMMFITSDAIILIHDKKGIFFERLHTQIASVEATGKKRIKITWPENHQLFDFTFKINDAELHVKDILNMHNYDDNFPDMMGVTHVLYSDGDKKKIIEKRLNISDKVLEYFRKELDKENLNVNTISQSDPDKTKKILEGVGETNKLHNAITMWENYQKDLVTMTINRSKKIPSGIQNHQCWNDCWYDKESDCIITFNKLWENDYYKEYEGVKKFYQKNKINNVYAIPYDIVQMVNGYPTYPVIYGENDTRLVFIPTMTDEMLTDSIISKKFGIDVDTVGNGLPVKTKQSMEYLTSIGSRMILKNGKRSGTTRKETIFFMNRSMLSKEELVLLP